MTQLAQTRRFEPAMTVGDALALHPSARWVFASYQLGGCSQCSISTEETLDQVAAGYNFSLESFLKDLNSLLDR